MKKLTSPKKISVKSEPALNKHQKLLLQRIENITIAILSQCKSEKEVIHASTLNDNELMKWLIMAYNPKITNESEIKIDKNHQRKVNLEEFYQHLKQIGGVIDIKRVAELLNISQSAVNILIKKNKLLAFKKNGSYIFPVFQFNKSGLIPGFEELMSAFPTDIHPIFRLGVMNAKILLDDGHTSKTPIEILRDGASRKELDLAIRAAILFGNQIAN
ncbi:helix-turn-helix domain-containing protein [Klebsiella oxytoca]|nr:helix-turn-helix domain-containing protein [Klebsiella oxytoca]